MSTQDDSMAAEPPQHGKTDAVRVGSREMVGPPLWVIRYPDGMIDHTTLDIREDWCIDRFLRTERHVSWLAGRTSPTPSWEVHEAEGYRVVPCDLVERRPNAAYQPRRGEQESP